MIELVASALVAAAALGFVLEPLVRRTPPARPESRPAAPDERANLLVERMRARLVSHCGACRRSAEPGAIFCSNCGRILIVP